MNLQSLILLVLKASIFLTVFAMGLQATFAGATFLFRRPRLLIRGFFSMSVVMPALALLLVLTTTPTPSREDRPGCPFAFSGSTHVSKESTQGWRQRKYTIGLLVATVLLAFVAIPIAMETFERVTGVPLYMSALKVATIVFSTVLAPLLIGIVLRAVALSFADRVAQFVGKVVGVLLILGVLPVLFVSMRTILSLVGDGTLSQLCCFRTDWLHRRPFLWRA